MDTDLLLLWVIFVIVGLLGLYFAYLYGKNTDKFKWSEYIAMIIFPILFIIFLAFYYDFSILYMFLIGSIVGSIAELIVGFAYDKILGKRLWTYSRLGIGGYTSILSIPMWGIGGVICWFIVKIIGG